MPPTDDVKGSVEDILEKFSENYEDEDGHPNKHAFWDWYVIGGRWDGAKLTARYPEEKISAFRQELHDKNVTVAGMQWGKQEISPASQIPMVDEIWRKHFPDGGQVCPLFKHFGNKQLNDSLTEFNVCRLDQMPELLECARVMIVSKDEDEYEVHSMKQESVWNGVEHLDTKWDGTVRSALAEFEKRSEGWKESYRERCRPKADWLVVTVDYHT